MLKKTYTYVDFDGNERTEDFYFNLSKSEVLEMELSTTGGLKNWIDNIIAEQNAPEIMKMFKVIILKSYGKKSPDGKRFMKSEEISKEFSETNAYDELFMELATDADAAADFIDGILPKDDTEESPSSKVAPISGLTPVNPSNS